MSKILIVEDEQSIQKLLRYDLNIAGYEVECASDGESGLELALNKPFDVMIIDWMLPKLSGIEIIKEVRKAQIETIIILLTAKDDETDILEGFEAGCDDYMTKPFSPRQLQARIKAHLKRIKPNDTDRYVIANLEMDIDRYEVLVDQDKVLLTKTEFELLRYLMTHEDRVLSREQILNEIWNFDYDGDTRIVDVHIFKLRSKLEGAQVVIESVRGVGYVLKKK